MKQGDVVQLGRHRLLCGDAFNPEHVDALMQGVKPDMLYCDPPYGIALETDYSTKINEPGFAERKNVRQGRKYERIEGDEIDFDPQPLIRRFATTKEQFWWGANNYCQRLPAGGGWLVWDKRLTESADRMFGSAFELCWSRQIHKYNMVRIKWAGVFGTEREPGKKRVHPAHKPVLLAEWFIEKYSKPNGVVCDLFAGGGSSLLACERMDRRALCMEISPDYCDVIIRRYEQMTQQPKLLEVS